MNKKNIEYSPYIITKESTQVAMLDVILCLILLLIPAYLAWGIRPILVTIVSVLGAVSIEFLFNFFLRKKTVLDLSAVVTGILLAYTLGPNMPFSVVFIGGAVAILFGKLLSGGIGTNRLNPALYGRKILSLLFPVVLTSGSIWHIEHHQGMNKIDMGNDLISDLIYNPSGAIGEYCILLLIIGGLYLLIRKRISWHIPVISLASLYILKYVLANNNIVTEKEMAVSFGGLFLGMIFMATDMPTSPTTPIGKSYYALCLGILTLMFKVKGVNYEYLSYAILLMNCFVPYINNSTKPKVFGKPVMLLKNTKGLFLITIMISLAFALVIYLDSIKIGHYSGVYILIILYMIYSIFNFITKKIYKRK